MMHHASNVGVQSVAGPDPVMEGRPQQHTPLWMDVPQQPPQRTGATPSRYSTLTTIAFFALITIAVGGAGLAGIALWGPEKTIKNRTQLATNPPPPTTMPSLPESADPPSTPPVADSASAAPTSSAPAASSPKKTKKPPQRHRGKKRR